VLTGLGQDVREARDDPGIEVSVLSDQGPRPFEKPPGIAVAAAIGSMDASSVEILR
jgi:hypothetical protein